MMTGDNSQKKKTKPPSALHVMRGVEGGHDGLPGSKGNRNANSSRRNNHVNLTIEEFKNGILGGDRTVVGRAVTLIESDANEHQERAQELLKEIIPYSGKSIRVGISGMPGAGKSTFIEALGCHLTGRGHKVAVLAVDPSSSLTRGSILGDKTRMEQLARDENAFIRPSPSGGTLGGVARKTREAVLVFEAAGFDVVLVETIGVGQSEITVRSMVDFFLLVLIAGAGDELQGIKRGVMEIADAIAVNKADGDNIEKANRARSEYEQAVHYLQPATEGWQTRAFAVSALLNSGISELWEVVESFQKITTESGEFEKRRREQSRQWLHSMLEERMRSMFYHHPDIKQQLPLLEKAVMNGEIPATQAARQLMKSFKY